MFSWEISEFFQHKVCQRKFFMVVYIYENLNRGEAMAEKQYVVFGLDGQEYGVDIITVQEIILPTKVTKLPNMPSHVLGVFNLRGNIITLLDLKIRFGMKKSEQTENTRYIVMKVDENSFGILVDEIHEVVKIKDESIEVSNNISTAINQEYINGVAQEGERLIIMLRLTATI
jgi:purine-binding chemotaxis protein CheW